MIRTALVALLTVGLLVGCGASATSSSMSAAAPTASRPVTVKGVVSVPSGAGTYDPKTDKPSVFGHPCSAAQGYDDIRPGAQVVARTGSTTIGVGQLSAGWIGDPFVCQFRWEATLTQPLPAVVDFAVATRGGAVSVPAAQLDQIVGISVGL